MTKHKKLSARILSMALSVAMVSNILPMQAFATEGDVPIGASSINTVGRIQSFDKLGDRFAKSTGTNAPDHVYSLSVALDTPVEDLPFPTELAAMVARTTAAPAVDEPVLDSGKPFEPAEDKVVEGDTTTDDTVSGNQPASPSDAEEEVKEEIKDEDVPLAPESEQDKETTVTTVERENVPVTWHSNKEYKSDVNGQFIYTAVLTEGYTLADGVNLPQIYVMVGRQARAATATQRRTTLNLHTISPTNLMGATYSDGVYTHVAEKWVFNSTTKTLTLSGVDFILSGTNIGINLPEDAGVIIELIEGTANSIITTANSRCIYSKEDIEIKGGGSLTLVSGNNAALFSTKTITVTNGTLDCTTKSPNSNAITAFNGWTINGGTVSAKVDNSNLRTPPLNKSPTLGTGVIRTSTADWDNTSGETVTYGFPIAITINNQAYAGNSLADALSKLSGGVAAVTSLKITAGTVTADDWNYLKSLTALTTFEIADTIPNGKVANIPSIEGTPIFPGSIVIVTVPQAITIGIHTFTNCTSLTNVSFAAATSIGTNAFSGCSALTTASLPMLTSIGVSAFVGCTSLVTASFPEVTSIGENAFRNCTGLTTVSLPKATSIGMTAFFGCTSLATLNLPATPPTTVGSGAFTGCPTTRALGYLNATGDALTGDALTAAQVAYKEATDGDTTDNLWYGWTIETVAAPITITIDGTDYPGNSLADAIRKLSGGVAAVNSLKITAGTVTEVDWNYLWNLTALEIFEIDEEVTPVADIPNSSSSYSIFPASIVTVTVPQAITIGVRAFTNCTALATVNFPAATSISSTAFNGCTSLATANIPAATSIADNAFFSCTSLTSASFPVATSIGNGAFYNCTALATLKLGATPPTVTYDSVFGNCPAPRALGYVDADGKALTGDALTAARVAYKAVADGSTTNNLWYGWTIESAASIPDYTGTQAAAPSSTPASKTATSVTLAAVTVAGKTIEYAVSTSATAPTTDWQDGTAFTGLTADTQYYFFARVKATTAHKAGTASAGTAIKTDKTDAQKLAAAKILANAEIGNLAATNRTTAASILSTVNTAITSVDGVTATWKSGSPTITAATDSAAGSITGTIVLTCGTTTVEVTVNKTIAQIGSDAEKVESAKTAAVSALGDYTATNATAASDIMTLVDAAITDAGITGITSSWNVAFSKTNATTSEDGSVTGTITLTLNDVTTNIAINLTIAQLTDKATLTAAITAANTAKSGITVSDNAASSVASGTRFVTTAEMKALTDAITAAQAVANNPTSTAVQVSAAVTALNNAVTTFNAAIKTGTYSGGSSGDSDSDSSSGDSAPPASNVIDNPVGNSGTTDTLTEVVKNAVASSATSTTANVNYANYSALTIDGLKAINDVVANTVAGKNFHLNTKLQLDNKAGNVVLSRIYVDPTKLTAVMPERLPLGVWFDQQKDAQVSSVKAAFEKGFDNNLVVVTFEQKTPLMVNMELALKPDMSKLNTKNLHFYSYNSETNLYRRILSPDYWVDQNGYTHITAPLGGSIIITDKPLTLK